MVTYSESTSKKSSSHVLKYGNLFLLSSLLEEYICTTMTISFYRIISSEESSVPPENLAFFLSSSSRLFWISLSSSSSFCIYFMNLSSSFFIYSSLLDSSRAYPTSLSTDGLSMFYSHLINLWNLSSSCMLSFRSLIYFEKLWLRNLRMESMFEINVVFLYLIPGNESDGSILLDGWIRIINLLFYIVQPFRIIWLRG